MKGITRTTPFSAERTLVFGCRDLAALKVRVHGINLALRLNNSGVPFFKYFQSKSSALYVVRADLSRRCLQYARNSRAWSAGTKETFHLAH